MVILFLAFCLNQIISVHYFVEKFDRWIKVDYKPKFWIFVHFPETDYQKVFVFVLHDFRGNMGHYFTASLHESKVEW